MSLGGGEAHLGATHSATSILTQIVLSQRPEYAESEALVMKTENEEEVKGNRTPHVDYGRSRGKLMMFLNELRN